MRQWGMAAAAFSTLTALIFAAPRAAQALCGGDCEGAGVVTVEQVVRLVNIGLQNAGPEACAAADGDFDGMVTAGDARLAVQNGLGGCPREDSRAFVVATDFQTGSFATVTLDEPRQVVKANPQRRIHSDAVARTYGGLVYVVNRFFGDNIQVLDPASDFATVWQCSTEAKSNPHDIAFASPSKAYVSRSDKTSLWIVDPSAPPGCANFKIGEIDLAAFADADGIPEMDQMAMIGRRLYVLIQYLNRDAVFAPAGPGRIAVIDIDSDEVVDDITLSGENPFAQTKGLVVRDGKLAIGMSGRYTVADGGIELVDPVAGQAEGLLITEENLGGDVTDFVLLSDRLGYAILSLADFTNSLVAFDPSQKRVIRTLISGSTFVADIEVDTRGELFVADRTFDAPGLRIFRASDGEPLTDGRVDMGLPPFDILFLK